MRSTQSVIWSHIDKIDAISDLRVLGRHYTQIPNHDIFERQSETQPCAYFHREHRGPTFYRATRCV
jgi:hypothetical protein